MILDTERADTPATPPDTAVPIFISGYRSIVQVN
jgi:hypothetical protein